VQVVRSDQARCFEEKAPRFSREVFEEEKLQRSLMHHNALTAHRDPLE